MCQSMCDPFQTEPFPVRSDGQLNKMLADCFHMCLMHNVAEDNSLHEALLEGKRVLAIMD